MTPRDKRVGAVGSTGLSQAQLQELRETFNVLDHDGDGSITEKDLNLAMTAMGEVVSQGTIANLLKTSPSSGQPLTFPVFLAMMTGLMSKFDTTDKLCHAFGCFDKNDEGKVDSGELESWLKERGNRMTDAEIRLILSRRSEPSFIDRSGRFDYLEFADEISALLGENVINQVR